MQNSFMMQVYVCSTCMYNNINHINVDSLFGLKYWWSFFYMHSIKKKWTHQESIEEEFFLLSQKMRIVNNVRIVRSKWLFYTFARHKHLHTRYLSNHLNLACFVWFWFANASLLTSIWRRHTHSNIINDWRFILL